MVRERQRRAQEGRMRERELQKSVGKREGKEGCKEGDVDNKNVRNREGCEKGRRMEGNEEKKCKRHVMNT